MGSPRVGDYITPAAPLTIEERAESLARALEGASLARALEGASLARALEGAEAFLLGVAMDGGVPGRVREALRDKAEELRREVARHSCPTCGSLLLVSEPHCSPDEPTDAPKE